MRDKNNTLISYPSSLITLNGWIILDKPLGMSSAQAVARVKRIVRPGKIGHAGTLDPLATGVLPLALGEATKAVNLMMDAKKAYQFEVTWGEERATDDAEGAVTQTSNLRPTLEAISQVLPQFIGDIAQIPPNYSALHLDGARAYALARAGEEVVLASRQVRVEKLVISDKWQVARNSLPTTSHLPLLTTSFLCHCGKGTYIRSIARDMGRVLGCFGYVSALRRTQVGVFSENDAISLESLEEIVHKGGLGFLKPVERVLDDILALSLTADEAKRLTHGQTVPYHGAAREGENVVTTCEGKLLALCEVQGAHLKPKRVFNH